LRWAVREGCGGGWQAGSIQHRQRSHDHLRFDDWSLRSRGPRGARLAGRASRAGGAGATSLTSGSGRARGALCPGRPRRAIPASLTVSASRASRSNSAIRARWSCGPDRAHLAILPVCAPRPGWSLGSDWSRWSKITVPAVRADRPGGAGGAVLSRWPPISLRSWRALGALLPGGTFWASGTGWTFGTLRASRSRISLGARLALWSRWSGLTRRAIRSARSRGPRGTGWASLVPLFGIDDGAPVRCRARGGFIVVFRRRSLLIAAFAPDRRRLLATFGAPLGVAAVTSIAALAAIVLAMPLFHRRRGIGQPQGREQRHASGPERAQGRAPPGWIDHEHR
jgi:hypothetical protein